MKPTHPAAWLATWFGAGLLPKAPGTWGSLAALPFAWGLNKAFGPVGLIVAALVVFLVGWWAAAVYARSDGDGDPGPVVIDEVAAQWLTLVPAGDNLWLYGAGFLLFRLFDVWKPFPIGWADRNVKGGLGIMFDDVLAAIYSTGGVYLLGKFGGAF